MINDQSKKYNQNYLGNIVVKFLKGIKLSFLNEFSLYDLLKLYLGGIMKGALTTRASSITLSFFMAIFPFVLFIIAVIPFIPVDNFRQDFFIFLDSILPPTTTDFFINNIFETINSSDNAGLLSTTFIIALILMANGINSVFYGFQNSYHQTLNRSFISQYTISFLLAIGFSIILIFSVLLSGFLNIYVINNLEYYGLIENSQAISGLIVIKNLLIIIMVYFATSILYYYGAKEKKYIKLFSVGAVMTTSLFIVNSYLFGLYVIKFSSYNELYGSIGALLVLLLFIWLNANILLLGFELNTSINFFKNKNK